MNLLKKCVPRIKKGKRKRGRCGKWQLPIFVKQSSVPVSQQKTFLFGNLDQLMFSLIFIMIKYYYYLLPLVSHSNAKIIAKKFYSKQYKGCSCPNQGRLSTIKLLLLQKLESNSWITSLVMFSH